MQYYEKTITVVEDDLDELHHVNNVRYLQWIQDVSKEHWQILVSPERQEAMVWVVMRHEIDYKNAAVIADRLRITTRIETNHGATCIRVVEIMNARTDTTVVKSSTQWCLLNSTSFKPMRIPNDIIEIFNTD